MYEIVSIKDQSRWNQILHLFPSSDTYYTPEYFCSAMKLDPGDAFLFYFEGKDGEVAYPFIRRKIGDEAAADFYDVTTPFGYGGPLLNIKHDVSELADHFRRAFVDYCRKERIIAEYIRFHPLKQNALFFKYHLKLFPAYDTYTLKLDEMEMKKEKQEVQQGIVVKKLGTVRHMFEFLILYYSTVRRREEADSYYFFTNDYFESLVSSFGPDLHLFGAFKGEQLLAACYILACGNTIFVHTEGSSGETEDERSKRELLLNIAEWGKENDYQFFHMGGDHEEGELIKGELVPVSVRKFYIGRCIFDEPVFDGLVSETESEMIRRYKNS